MWRQCKLDHFMLWRRTMHAARLSIRGIASTASTPTTTTLSVAPASDTIIAPSPASPPPPPPPPPPRHLTRGKMALLSLALTSAAVAVALVVEDVWASKRIKDRILAWQTIPQGALRLPDSFVPHSTSIGAIADFIVDALARPLAAVDSSNSLPSGQGQGQRILGVYGPCLSGKSTSQRAAFGQLIREAAQHDTGASDHSAASSITTSAAAGSASATNGVTAAASVSSGATTSTRATASASALPLAGVEGAVTGSLLRAAGGLAATEKVRLVYLPVGDNFKVARHVTQLMADMLGYRPMYFFLISRLPLAWRFDSPAADVAAMFSALEQASLELKREQNVRVFVCVENLHRIVCSRHMLLLNDTAAPAPAPTGVQSVSGAPTFSRTPPQTIVASTDGYTNMNKNLASAREGDAMIAQLIQSVKRATAGASNSDTGAGSGADTNKAGSAAGSSAGGGGGGAFDFCFTSSSPVAVLQMRDAWDTRLMRLHQQGTLRLDEARKLAQMRRTRFCDLTAAYVVSRSQDGDDDDEEEEDAKDKDKEKGKGKDDDKSMSEQPTAAAPPASVGSVSASSEPAQAATAATTAPLPPAPLRKSAHPDFLFAGAPPLSRPRVGAEQSGKDPATAAKTCGNDKPAAGASDAGDAPRAPLPPIVVDGAWNETEFHRVVAMVGLSPIFLRTVYDSQRPLEQAKRVLGARLLSLTPYMFTNNFAMEEAWQSGGMPALSRLLRHRCEAVRLLESVYADQARAQAAEAAEAPASWWPLAFSSSASSSSAGWLQCSPTVALSETSDADCRAITARLDRLSLSVSSPPSPSSTLSSKNGTVSGAAAAAATAATEAGRANLRAVAQSTIGATMLDSGVLCADIDSGALRIATVAHARAFERLRARQRLAPIGAACTAFGVPPAAAMNAASKAAAATATATATAPLTEEQLLDCAGKMSATLKTTNMWL